MTVTASQDEKRLKAEQEDIVTKETNVIETGTMRLLGRRWFASLLII
ncbi:hypothetical protein TUM17377_32180 [Shewanella chilikensis]|jgi:hypothetical protein|nr:hypothetical protein TUM17377_32180 [Shewanella chilikensis]GGZ47912.1 hypothetical protein GCM10007105_37350 [Shewanella chilikensis]